MVNSTTNAKKFGNVAVTATGNAFGIVNEYGDLDRLENWQAENDMIDWTGVGKLNVSGFWNLSEPWYLT